MIGCRLRCCSRHRGLDAQAAEIGDRDWHALLDAHDAVVRSQLARFRGREVNTSATASWRCLTARNGRSAAMAIRDAVQSLGIEVRSGCTPASARSAARTSAESRYRPVPASAPRPGRMRCWCPARCATWSSGQGSSSKTAASRAQGCAGRMAPLRRRFFIAVGCGDVYFACRNQLVHPVTPI